MAGRVKPGSGKPKAKKRGSNLPLDSAEAEEAMAGIFAAKEKLKKDTGKLRKAIGDEIATAASRLEVSQKKVKLLIAKKELADKEAAEFAEMHGADKAELNKLAAMFGESSPFGSTRRKRPTRSTTTTSSPPARVAKAPTVRRKTDGRRWWRARPRSRHHHRLCAGRP
jgi:hypothetical protein